MRALSAGQGGPPSAGSRRGGGTPWRAVFERGSAIAAGGLRLGGVQTGRVDAPWHLLKQVTTIVDRISPPTFPPLFGFPRVNAPPTRRMEAKERTK